MSAVSAQDCVTQNPCNAHLVSLGPNCETAGMKGLLGLGSAHCPFDLMTTQNFSIVCDLIENRFDGFFDRNNLQYLGVGLSAGKQVYINTKYQGVHFNHEFSEAHSIDTCYEQEFAKYQRRIARFYEILESKEPVFFFRRSVEYKDAIRFCDLIKKLSPQLNFVLVSIFASGDKTKINDYELPLVRKFRVSHRPWTDWRNPEHVQAWHDVFSALGLLPTDLSVERIPFMVLSDEFFWNLNHE